MIKLIFLLFALEVRSLVLRIPVQRILRTTNISNPIGIAYDRFGQRLQNNRDIEYRGFVSLGQPPQAFLVVFDTGSDLLWVPAAGCKSSGPFVNTCKTQTAVYHPEKSLTAEPLNQTFDIEYGTGSSHGRYYKDKFAFGSPHGKQLKLRGKVTFGAASRMTFSDEGILGLSLPHPGSPLPVFIQAVREGLMDAPVFTTYMRKCDGSCRDGGLITLGGLDVNHCGQVVGWIPIARDSVHWRFKMDRVQTSSFVSKDPIDAITDTGTSFIIGPSGIVDQLARSIGAEQTGGIYILPCNKRFTLTLGIAGNNYPIPSKQLLLKEDESGLCVLALAGGDEFDFFILGNPFIRQFCQIQNVAKLQLGFALAR